MFKSYPCHGVLGDCEELPCISLGIGVEWERCGVTCLIGLQRTSGARSPRSSKKIVMMGPLVLSSARLKEPSEGNDLRGSPASCHVLVRDGPAVYIHSQVGLASIFKSSSFFFSFLSASTRVIWPCLAGMLPPRRPRGLVSPGIALSARVHQMSDRLHSLMQIILQLYEPPPRWLERGIK